MLRNIRAAGVTVATKQPVIDCTEHFLQHRASDLQGPCILSSRAVGEPLGRILVFTMNQSLFLVSRSGVYVRWERQEKRVWGGDRSNSLGCAVFRASCCTERDSPEASNHPGREITSR